MTNFQIYKAEINRLLEKTQTGGGWEVSFTDKQDIDSSNARCTYNIECRWVRFSFNVEANKTYGKMSIVKTAKHEFGHFITAKLCHLAECRYVTPEEIDEEMESIARIFERM